MNTFPLIKVRWTNEHIMAGLYLVLVLYYIPVWVENPSALVDFLLLTATGLFLDAAANVIRYKRLWCCVSGAVTAAILSLLTAGIPVSEQLVGLAAALIIGKYLWGGTGKNKLNPAMVGLLIIAVIWNVPLPFFLPSYLLIPAILLGLLFLKSRPYAGIGFLAGCLAALLVHHDLSMTSLFADGVFFWSCVVMTDPVTVTRNRIAGLLSGLIGGFLALYLSPSALNFAAIILTINVFSYVFEDAFETFGQGKPGVMIPKVFSCKDNILDLAGTKVSAEEADLGVNELTAEEIIGNLQSNAVFGMGGAAFPAYKKIAAVRQAEKDKKYLIVNGVECDPGLYHDQYLLKQYSEEIVKGIKLLKTCLDFTAVYLAVKSTEGITVSGEIKLTKVPDRYPAGAEKILIQNILDIHLEQKQIPAECGILVLNVQTVYSIYQAIYFNLQTDTRYLTAADLKNKTAQVVKVRMGMKLQDVIQSVFPGSSRVFAGGGIMQAHVAQDGEAVDKSINFIASGGIPKYKESPQCSHCGDCISHCPAGLRVNKIADLVDQGRVKDAIKYNPQECISCGSCSYSCRAGRNLAMKIKAAKEAALRQNDKSE